MSDKKDFTQWHEEMISGNYKRSTANEKDIEALEKADIRFTANMESLSKDIQRICVNVKALTKVLWALGFLLATTLITAIVQSFL
jgi:hypothetical protein